MKLQKLVFIFYFIINIIYATSLNRIVVEVDLD